MKTVKSGLILTLLIFFNTITLLAQNKPEVVITKIEEINDQIHITYDIINYQKEQLFYISPLITDSKGKKIEAKHVSGDINKKLPGNTGYKLVWDLTKDNIFLDEKLNIRLVADISINLSQYSFAGLLLSSTLMPGAGLKKLNRDKSPRILGVFGYSFLASAVFFRLKSNATYSDYENNDEPSERNQLYNNMETYDKISNYSLYAAAGIWAINYISLTSKWLNNRKKSGYAWKKQINFYANYNPIIHKPVLTFSYNF